MKKIFLSVVLVLTFTTNAFSEKMQGPCCALTGPTHPSSYELPIVPGLEGYGVTTPAGSGPDRVGGTIIHVTNLNASGAGSLKEAIDTEGPRVIVFDVSGYIDITASGEIKIQEPYVTVACQTAPSPGVSLRGNGFRVETHDVLIHHCRTRVGDELPGEDGDTRDGLEIIDVPENSGNTYNVVIDHNSVSWGLDENMSVIQGTKKVTIANTIIGEALDSPLHTKDGRAFGLLYNGSVTEISAIKNLFAHNNGRNPVSQAFQETTFFNNVVYNWGEEAGSFSDNSGSGTGPNKFVAGGNVYIRGLDTILFYPFKISVVNFEIMEYYFFDNLSANTPNPRVQDEWLNVVIEDSLVPEADIRVEYAPFALPAPLNVLESQTVEAIILNNVGARPANRDAVDTRIVADVTAGTGNHLTSQTEVGGWPVLAENTSVAATPSDPWIIQSSGYNNLEEWLHAQAEAVEN